MRKQLLVLPFLGEVKLQGQARHRAGWRVRREEREDKRRGSRLQDVCVRVHMEGVRVGRRWDEGGVRSVADGKRKMRRRREGGARG